MALRGDQIKKQRNWKYVSFGPPKGAGKTSLAMTAPGNKLVLQYDLGTTSIPPIVDPSTVFVQDYPDTDRKGLSATSDKWRRTREVYEHVIRDLDAVVESFEGSGKMDIKLHDGTTVPRPDMLILDGLVRFDNIIVDGFCAINNINDPGDAMDSRGKVGAGVQKFWGRRLSVINKLFGLVISLPINIAALTWEKVVEQKDSFGNTTSLKREPDIGGRLDVWGPGMFDACIYQYSQLGRYFVQTQSDSEIQRLGIRDCYNMPAKIDVTLDPKATETPFGKVFGSVVPKDPVARLAI
jgi:hypothetical protein